MSGPEVGVPHRQSHPEALTPPVLVPVNGHLNGDGANGVVDPHTNGHAPMAAHGNARVLDALLLPQHGASPGAEITRWPSTMSFDEYLERVIASPRVLLRNSAAYLRDAISCDVDEARTIRRFGVKIPRYPFLLDPHLPEGGRDPALGMDSVVHQIRHVLDEQAQQPFMRRWIQLSGPFASGKSTLIAVLMRRLQHYSQNHPDGVIYRPLFVLPGQKEGEERPLRLPELVRCDPLFLLTDERARRGLLDRVLKEHPKSPYRTDWNYVLREGIDPLVSQILRTLLQKEKHDMRAVLRKYVRVERCTFSLHEGNGIVMLTPGQRATPFAWPLMGREAVPEELQPIAHDLYGVGDAFTSAHRGLVVFDNIGHEQAGEDPEHRAQTSLDPYRETIESGTQQITTVASDGRSLRRVIPVDVVPVGCINDVHLTGILRAPDRVGRLLSIARPVSVPLLCNVFDERALLEHKMKGKCVPADEMSPHVTLLVSLFAVSTRLLRPLAESYETKRRSYPKDFPALTERLTSVAKAIFLAQPSDEWPLDAVNWALPEEERFTQSELSRLFHYQRDIAEEFAKGVGETRAALYDGGLGLDGRELEALLLQLVDASEEGGVSVSEVMTRLERRANELFAYEERSQGQMDGELERLKKAEEESPLSKAVIERLQNSAFALEAPDIVAQVMQVGRRLVRQDIARALQLPFGSQAKEELKRYLAHIRAELVPNFEVPREFRVRPQEAKADARFLADMAQRLGTSARDASQHRQQLLGQLSAWAQAHPERDINESLPEIFPEQIEKLESYYRRDAGPREREFFEDCKRFQGNRELAEASIGKEPDRARIERWLAAWNRLTSGSDSVPRYLEATLLREIAWAYEGMF